MFKFRKLSAEEVARLKKPKIQIDLEEYKREIRDLAVGDGGDLILGEGEDYSVAKRRLTLAAHELGFDIAYKKQPNGTWSWRLTDLTQKAS